MGPQGRRWASNHQLIAGKPTEGGAFGNFRGVTFLSVASFRDSAGVPERGGAGQRRSGPLERTCAPDAGRRRGPKGPRGAAGGGPRGPAPTGPLQASPRDASLLGKAKTGKQALRSHPRKLSASGAQGAAPHVRRLLSPSFTGGRSPRGHVPPCEPLCPPPPSAITQKTQRGSSWDLVESPRRSHFALSRRGTSHK